MGRGFWFTPRSASRTAWHTGMASSSYHKNLLAGDQRTQPTGCLSRHPLAKARPMTDQLEKTKLPDGLIEDAYGVIRYECNSCCAWAEWFGEIDEFELGDRNNLCGGSERCIP
jgi:hypothetical protein